MDIRAKECGHWVGTKMEEKNAARGRKQREAPKLDNKVRHAYHHS